MYDKMREKELPRKRKILPPVLSLLIVLFVGLLGVGMLYIRTSTAASFTDFAIEPKAGNWQTWVLESGDQFRPDSPPDKQTTELEIEYLENLKGQRTPLAMEKINYWTAVPTSYRWNRIAIDAMVDANVNTLTANRYLAILNTTMYDGMVAAWDAKYNYRRKRPSEYSEGFDAAVNVPSSPSYPSEDAVGAGVAYLVLSTLMPEKEELFKAEANEVMRLVQVAGIQYPSDVTVGFDLGKRIAVLAMTRAMADGSDAKWDGVIPTGPGKWTGENPALPLMGDWKTWVLESGDQFRPAPPLAHDSAELAAEMDELRALVEKRTGKNATHGFFWEFGAGGVRNFWFWNDHAGRKILETGMGSNPPRSARTLALLNVALYDAGVACWDAKYEYWAFRPFHYDPQFKTMFTTPNHPGYPSAHSCLSVAASDVLGYLFPNDAAEFAAYSTEAGEARIWAGLHFRSDINAGTQLAHDVAGAVIEYAEKDGSK